MANVNLRNITNSFLDVRLASLASWKQASEFPGRDRGGPYVVLQEGYDPEDPKVTADEFVLGRSGKWLSLSLFYKMPVPDRRAEFVFGTAAEVITLMRDLPPKVSVMRGRPDETSEAPPATDEMAAAIHTAKQQPGGGGAS
jgi:xanthine/CO dehydrogenase XdhC/CoxF family maturation factor